MKPETLRSLFVLLESGAGAAIRGARRLLAGSARDSRRSRAPSRQWTGLEELEPRLLFSAAPLAPELSLDLPGGDDHEPACVEVLAATSGATADRVRHEVVFIDAAVPDSDRLLDDLLGGRHDGREIEVILLDGQEDGVDQIREALSRCGEVDAVHIVSHAEDGVLRLGSASLSANDLGDHADALRGWGKSLAPDADILFYGCDLARGPDGRSLVDSIQRLTGADVAASTDRTGASALGGDWDLELRAGAIETDLPFSGALQRSWFGVLAAADAIWFSTTSDVPLATGTPGLTSWTGGEVLKIGGPTLALEPGTTAGTLSSILNLDSMALDGNADIDGLHFVSQDTTVGTLTPMTLRRGDIIFSVENNETLTSTNSLSVNDDDVFLFRPDTPGDYSSGTFILVLDNLQALTGASDIVDISLVEQDTLVGDRTLNEGDFIFSRNSGSQGNDIYVFSPLSTGAGLTLGTTSTLIEGDDIGISDKITGLELIEEDTDIGGITLQAGQILVAIDNPAPSVGDNGLAVNRGDVFSLTVTQTTTILATASADATLVFQGSDVGLDTNPESPDALALFSTNGALPILGTNAGLTTSEGGTGTITTARLQATDADNTAAELTYTITTAPSNGVLKLNGAALSVNDTFTQDDIDQNRVTYTHGGGETASDLFQFGVSDGTGGSIPETTFNITITPVNDAPTLAANAGLTVNEGGNGTLTTAALQATDPDTGAAQLTYTLTAVPSRGTVSLNGTPLAVSGTFTQDDIDQGRVTYAHDGSETTGDAFTFSVGDGSGGSIGATTFNVTVNPANDAPVLAANTGVTVNEGATTTVTTAMLRTTDVDNTAAELRYTLTTAPANGSLRLNGTALAANGTFTQDDIDQGRVTYVHGGSETTSDAFTVSISDGAGGSIGPTAFAIGVNLQNDNPFLARSVAPSVDQGGTIRITSSFLLAADAETASSQLTYSLSSIPSSGVLKLNGVTLRTGDTFTQDDIDNDRVTYTHDGSTTTDDAFSFVISDTSGGTSPASALFITVTPLASPPPPPGPRDAPNEPGPGGGGPPVVRPQPPVSAPEPPPEFPRNDPIPTPPSSGGPDSFVDVPRGHGPSVPIDVPGDTTDGLAPAFVPSRSTPTPKVIAILQNAPVPAAPAGIPELFLPADGELSRKLDSMKEEMRPRGELDRLVAGSASLVGISLSVGYLVWTARAGYLLSMLLASLPAWTPVDPLPILDHADNEKDDEDPEDEETLESMLAGSDPQP